MSNINAIINGWTFQTAAGIYLFLKNIKDISDFKFEGSDDLYYRFSSGKKLFAEAKASEKPNDKLKRHLTYHLQGALKKIEKSNNVQDEYVYITNISKPFNDDLSMIHDETLNYNQLNKEQKKIVDTIVSKEKRDTLRITNLKYSTGNEFLAVENELSSLLVQVDDAVLLYKAREIIEIWFSKVFLNGNKKSEFINKNLLVWKIVVCLLDNNVKDAINKLDVPPHIEYTLNEKYNQFIMSEFENNINMIQKISSQYYLDYHEHGSMPIDYEKNYYHLCEDEIREAFPHLGEEEIVYLSKIVVINIIKKSNTIDKVLKVTNCEN
jgi:hypothetical protein